MGGKMESVTLSTRAPLKLIGLVLTYLVLATATVVWLSWGPAEWGELWLMVFKNPLTWALYSVPIVALNLHQKEGPSSERESSLLTLDHEIIKQGVCAENNKSGPFPRNDFNLLLLIQQCLKSFQVQAEAKGLELTSNIRDDVPAKVYGSEKLWEKVLSNLLDNAVKYTETGGISLSIKILERSGSDVLLRLEVIDTGRGIKAQQQQSLFKDTSENYETSLVNTRTLVESMGGSIGVYSSPGQGSTFWLTAVLQKAPAN